MLYKDLHKLKTSNVLFRPIAPERVRKIIKDRYWDSKIARSWENERESYFTEGHTDTVTYKVVSIQKKILLRSYLLKQDYLWNEACILICPNKRISYRFSRDTGLGNFILICPGEIVDILQQTFFWRFCGQFI